MANCFNMTHLINWKETQETDDRTIVSHRLRINLHSFCDHYRTHHGKIVSHGPLHNNDIPSWTLLPAVTEPPLIAHTIPVYACDAITVAIADKIVQPLPPCSVNDRLTTEFPNWWEFVWAHFLLSNRRWLSGVGAQIRCHNSFSILFITSYLRISSTWPVCTIVSLVFLWRDIVPIQASFPWSLFDSAFLKISDSEPLCSFEMRKILTSRFENQCIHNRSL